jgi:hypothetical protein
VVPEVASTTGLPDGIFAYQNPHFGYIFEGLGMGNFGKFNDYMVF